MGAGRGAGAGAGAGAGGRAEAGAGVEVGGFTAGLEVEVAGLRQCRRVRRLRLRRPPPPQRLEGEPRGRTQLWEPGETRAPSRLPAALRWSPRRLRLWASRARASPGLAWRDGAGGRSRGVGGTQEPRT